MKDAVGGSLLLNIVVIFTSIVILFFVGIIAYSKAYKIKNRIIEVIEKNETYSPAIAENQLNNDLGRAGYIIASQDQIDEKCVKSGETNLNKVDPGKSGYLYCVYEKSCDQRELDPNTNEEVCTGERSYEVVTYIHFNFPVIGDLMTFAVRGETKTLGRIYNY